MYVNTIAKPKIGDADASIPYQDKLTNSSICSFSQAFKKHAPRIILTIVIKTTPTGSSSIIIQATIFTSIIVVTPQVFVPH
jgi:hypothetical protein